MGAQRRVVVVGAGVSGLTTALALAEAGAQVRVVTAADPRETTSAVASALVGPNLYPPDDPQRAWAAETMTTLAQAPPPGVTVREGLLTARPAGARPPFAELTPGFRECAPDELPAGFGTGFRVTLPTVDMPRYLAHLTDEVEKATGAPLETARLASLDDAADLAPLVANCTGLEAAALTGDDLEPVRGPRIVVRNPGLESFFLEAPMAPVWASFFPHGDHVVLGGSQRRSADTTPDPVEEADILRRCAEVEPRLAGAEVVEHVVGLRPGRARPRVEAEAGDRARIVHNYGHAGNGVMLSWGCARTAATLLLA